MQIEGTQSRDCEQFRFQNLSVSGDEEDICMKRSEHIEYFRTIASLRLKHGHSAFGRQFFDHVDMLMMASSGLVRLSQHTDDLML